MLLELRVENFAIIDSVHLGFRPGFNVLSGETGAGKSILLRSLALLMGEKADSSFVRDGADFALIEGCFDISSRPDIRRRLKEASIDANEDQLIIKRLVGSQSKARVYLNGSLSTLGLLREVVSPMVEVAGNSPLIEVTGQHDNQNLMSPNYHIELLDAYLGLTVQRVSFSELLLKRRDLSKELVQLGNEERERAQRIDFLKYNCDEILAAKLDITESEDLEIIAHKLRNQNKLNHFYSMVENTLNGEESSLLTSLQTLQTRGRDLSKFDSYSAQCCELFSESETKLREALDTIRAAQFALGADAEDLATLEERINRYRQLQRKYGPDADTILQELDKMQAELTELLSKESRISELEKLLQVLDIEVEKLGTSLHIKREAGLLKFITGVNQELLDLNMRGVHLRANCVYREEPTLNGYSDIELMVSFGPNSTPKPLAKAASGGELSRILLALKRTVGKSELPRTYLFDEVDTGVSGETAERVGQKLSLIAKDQQVICVTHLAQVAIFGNSHFSISKSAPSKSNPTPLMRVQELSGQDRVKEIARLISGEKVTETSLLHAKKLLESATTSSKPKKKSGHAEASI